MRKQKLLSIIILLLFACQLSAQVRMNQTAPYSKHYKTTNQLKKSAITLTSERSIDKRIITVDKDLFFREHKNLSPTQVVAIKVKTDYSLKNSGTWEQLKEGRLWRLKISATDASSLNFVLSEFFIPKGASLTIANLDKTLVMGPFTSKHNRKSKTFSTHLLYANEVILEYFEPNAVKAKGQITIGSVGYGIASTNNSTNEFKRKSGGARFNVPNDPCNYTLQNANCPQGDDISELKRAVCIMLIDLPDYFGQGTGTLVNNAEEDCRPLILTAGHNYPKDAQTNPHLLENLVLRFNFLRTGCNSNTPVDVNEVIDYCGANFVLNNFYNGFGVDICILEMKTMPTYKEYYAGWHSGWEWEHSFNPPIIDGKILTHPGGQTMKCYDFNRAQGDLFGIINCSVSGESYITYGASGSPLINAEKEVHGVLQDVDKGCQLSNNALQATSLYLSWNQTNWANNFPPFPAWIESVLDPNGILTTINGVKRLSGKERHELGCTSNTGNCCMVTTAFFVDETTDAEPTTDGFTCCNILHIEMKDEYNVAGCNNTFRVKVFETGSLTPLVNSNLTLPTDQTICTDIAAGSNFPNTTEYEIQIIDPVSGIVLDQCKKTLSFTCEEPNPCCESIAVQVTPQNLNLPNSCCFDIGGVAGTCFETQTIELHELINGSWQFITGTAPSPGGVFMFNNICRDNGVTSTFKVILRNAAGEVICEREVSYTCPDCCNVLTPIITPIGNSIIHHDGISYLRCCWDINIPWQQGENCEIGGWLLLDVGDPVPPTTFIFLPPNSNLGPFCSEDSTLDLSIVLGPGQTQNVTLHLNKVLAVYDVNGNLLCTQPIQETCTLTFTGPTSGGFELIASPNPFDNTLSVTADLNKTTLINIEIFDNIGRRVFVKDYGVQKAGTFETTIDVSALAQGVYILSINNGAKTINIFKEK